MGEPIPLHITANVESPIEQVKTSARRIISARTELAEHPSYSNSVTIHKLIRERNALISELRGYMKIAYNFDADLIEEVVQLCG